MNASWMILIGSKPLSRHYLPVPSLTLYGRVSSVPTFPGIRRFAEGRKYERWTGDDTKALMKVGLVFACLSAIESHDAVIGFHTGDSRPCTRQDGSGHRRLHGLLLFGSPHFS